MSDLKIAEIEDIPAIKEMMLKFKLESPYPDRPLDETKVEESILEYVSGDKTKTIVLLSFSEEKPVGIIVGTLQEFPFSREKHATEVIWWVEPELRRKNTGAELFEAFEYWATKLHAVVIHTGAPNENLEEYYKAKGYRPVEKLFMKEIN